MVVYFFVCLSLLLQYAAASSSFPGGRCQRSRLGTHSQQSQQWIQCLTSTSTPCPTKNIGNKGLMGLTESSTKLMIVDENVQNSRRFGEGMVIIFQIPDQYSIFFKRIFSHLCCCTRTCNFNEASFSKRSLREAVQRAFLGSFSLYNFKVRMPMSMCKCCPPKKKITWFATVPHVSG